MVVVPPAPEGSKIGAVYRLPSNWNGKILGIGGAAGMVHPATGYMLTPALQIAPLLARYLAARLPKASAGEIDRVVEFLERKAPAAKVSSG